MKEKNNFNLICNISIIIFIINYILLFCICINQGMNSAFGFVNNKILAIVILISIITFILIIKSNELFKVSFIFFITSYIYLFITYLNQENKVDFSYLDDKLLIALIILSIITSILIVKSNKILKVSFISLAVSCTYLFVIYLYVEGKLFPSCYFYFGDKSVITFTIPSIILSMFITKCNKNLKYPFISLLLISITLLMIVWL